MTLSSRVETRIEYPDGYNSLDPVRFSPSATQDWSDELFIVVAVLSRIGKDFHIKFKPGVKIPSRCSR